MDNPNSEKINVHMFWAYGQLSQLERLSLSSFIANDYKVTLWSYDQIKNAHPQAILKDAREIIPEALFFTHENKSPSGFANLFRYSIFTNYSGLYADLDVIALKKACFLPKHPFLVSERAKTHRNQQLNILAKNTFKNFILLKKFFKCNSVTYDKFLNFPNPKKQFCLSQDISVCSIKVNNNVFYNPNPEKGDIIDFCRVFAETISPKKIAPGHTGPFYMSCLFDHFPELGFQIMEPSFANPIDLQKCPQSLLKHDLSPIKNSHFLHCWNGRLSKVGFNKEAPYPKGSLLDTLAKKYL